MARNCEHMSLGPINLIMSSTDPDWFYFMQNKYLIFSILLAEIYLFDIFIALLKTKSAVVKTWISKCNVFPDSEKNTALEILFSFKHQIMKILKILSN